MYTLTTGIILTQIFYLWLVEYMSEEPMEVEGYLFSLEIHKLNPPKNCERQWELPGSLIGSLH